MVAESKPEPNRLPAEKRGGQIPAEGQIPANGQIPADEQIPADGQAADTAAPGDLLEFKAVKCRILLANADPISRHQISGALADLGHELVEVSSSAEALTEIANCPIDLAMVDVRLPDMGGIAFCKMLRKAEATHLVTIFILASPADCDLESQAICADADEFFIAPWNQSALRARVHATLRLKNMLESLDSSEEVLFSLAKSVENRDPDLGEHCQRLALMASAMGVALGLSNAATDTLQQGGYLHDIGKIEIPDRVLFKAGPLAPDEWDIMRSHATRGERICARTKSLATVLPIIRNHHEKFDGSGYPDGLKGNAIPLLARIVQVVDIYDALTTERPYKRAYTSDEALAIMREETGKGWRDPVLVEVFADLLPMFRRHSLEGSVRLSLHHLAESLTHYRQTSLRKLMPA